MSFLKNIRDNWAFYLFLIAIVIVVTVILSACTISPTRATPKQDYPDASTPPHIDEYNGGIIADITVSGKPYNVVTPNLAAKVQDWQKSTVGFITVTYQGHRLTAIDKGVMFWYSTRNL